MASHAWLAGGGAPGKLVALIGLCISSPAAGQPADRWSGHIAEASARFGIPEEWIRRVIAAESGGRASLNGHPITSRSGAIGLMQLMPGTWREMRSVHGFGTDPSSPRDNILAGTAYLRAMFDRFGYPGLFAAYNAGPKRYAEHLAIGRRLPAETVAYVAAVGGTPLRRPAVAAESNGGTVFVALSVFRPPRIEAPSQPMANSLFVRLSTASSQSR